MKLRWVFRVVVLALLAGNLAATWYTYQKTTSRINAQTARINRDATNVTASVALAIATNGHHVDAHLDRNWRMIIAARKAACEAFTAATSLPHYLYPSTCDEANMQPPSYYIRFWRQPTGWNAAN